MSEVEWNVRGATEVEHGGVRPAMLPTARVASESWDSRGVIIEVATLDEAPALANALAAEHVQLSVDNPEPLMDAIRQPLSRSVRA